jgi:hypothetical protein
LRFSKQKVFSKLLLHSGINPPTLKKILLLLFLLISGIRISNAQSYPAYTLNVCDTSNSTGYYFLDALGIGPSFGVYPTQMILDSIGRTVYYNVFYAGGGGDFTIQPNGLMSYSYHDKFYLMDNSFSILDSIECGNGILTDGHDLQILPNGHFLLLGYEYVTMDLSAYMFFGPNHNMAGSTTASVKCGVIQEQDANHNVVFEWHAKDHYAFADVDENYLNGPANVDWTHMNAVELDDDGNILLSLRHFNEITKINRADSSIIWRLGGNANQFTFTNDPLKFKGQHDIRRIANGNITLWDNGAFGPPVHIGSAKEYQLDENLLTATVVWNYIESPTAYSQAIGNVQRLSNGNTLIDFGITTLENRVFDVVDSSGNKIFELEFADTLRSYRVFNFNLPWQLPRPQITCAVISNQAYLDAGSGYASYLWSNGATTQTIPVTTADTFSVWVPVGVGGFIRSDFFIVSNPNYPCSPAGMENEINETEFSIYPDPANDEIFIQSSFEKNKNALIEIFDFTGKKIYSAEIIPSGDQINIPVSELAAGIYLISVNGVREKFVKM